MGMVAVSTVLSEAKVTKADWIGLFSNIGVLQTTVAEMITVKEHQRESQSISSTVFPRRRNC